MLELRYNDPAFVKIIINGAQYITSFLLHFGFNFGVTVKFGTLIMDFLKHI